MRFFVISLLALLSFMGLSVNAAVCICAHDTSAEQAIDAVPCCQDLPDRCCVKKDRDPQPKAPLAMVAPQADSLKLTLSAIATLTNDRALVRPHVSTYSQLARAPPPGPSTHRCQLQSWLL